MGLFTQTQQQMERLLYRAHRSCVIELLEIARRVSQVNYVQKLLMIAADIVQHFVSASEPFCANSAFQTSKERSALKFSRCINFVQINRRTDVRYPTF